MVLVVLVSIVSLLYAFASDTPPCFTRKPVGRIRVRFPVALDLGATSTVGIGTGTADGSDLAAFLAVFDRFSASSLGVNNGLG